jgi:uncharacterized membrane protein
MKKILWVLMAVFAILIGLYPILYFLIDRTFGLLNTKSDTLLSDAFWNAAFYTHITMGGLALFIGWTQFSAHWRRQYLVWHRAIGKIYIVTMVLSATSGVYIGYFATGGIISATGFIILGIISLYTTVMAYNKIKQGRIEEHKELMVYSYAACFAAVTLRLWLPLLSLVLGDFVTAYRIVSWLCWVPNIMVAVWINRR